MRTNLKGHLSVRSKRYKEENEGIFKRSVWKNNKKYIEVVVGYISDLFSGVQMSIYIGQHWV